MRPSRRDTTQMRHPSPATRAIRNNPVPTATAPVARATRLPRCELEGAGHQDDHTDRESTEPRLAWPANGLAVAPQHRDQGRQHHATITTHMQRKDFVAPGHVCPGIGISPIADMDASDDRHHRAGSGEQR